MPAEEENCPVDNFSADNLVRDSFDSGASSGSPLESISDSPHKIPILKAVRFSTVSTIHKGLWLGQTVALKTFRFHGTDASLAKVNQRLSVEVELWGRLQHRNVLPTIYLAGPMPSSCGMFSMVSPWITNGNIRDYLSTFPDINRRNLVAGVAAGLEYLHQSGVIHGDLKSTNILIDETGCPLLADFGMVAVLERNREPLSVTVSVRQRLRFDEDGGLDNVYPTSLVTSSRPVCRYMAPELLNNEQSYSTTASDVYMFACLCYESFVETQPFADIVSDIDVLLAIHRNEQPTRPSAEHPAELRGLDDSMWKLLESCWTANPVHRPNIHEVYTSLQEANYQDNIRGENGTGYKLSARL